MNNANLFILITQKKYIFWFCFFSGAGAPRSLLDELPHVQQPARATACRVVLRARGDSPAPRSHMPAAARSHGRVMPMCSRNALTCTGSSILSCSPTQSHASTSSLRSFSVDFIVHSCRMLSQTHIDSRSKDQTRGASVGRMTAPFNAAAQRFRSTLPLNAAAPNAAARSADPFVPYQP